MLLSLNSKLYGPDKYSVNITGKGYVKKLLISSLIALALSLVAAVLAPANDAKLSLFAFFILGSFPVFFYAKLLLGNINAYKIILLAYFIKGIIGIAHYLFFIDPSYFSHPSTIALTAVTDFDSMFYQISQYVEYWNFDYASFDKYSFIRHPEVYAGMSVYYKLAGLYILTILPINLMFSCFTAITFSYVVKIRKGNYLVTLLLCGFFPLSLISSYFFRDLFALWFCTLVICLIAISKKYWRLIFLILASYIMYMQREVYAIIPILSYFAYLILTAKRKNKAQNFILSILLLIIFIVLGWSTITGLFFEQEGYLGATKNIFFYLLFPLRYVMCIIGPFPWTQVLGRPENTYQMQDWLLSAALFYTTFIIFPLAYKLFKKKLMIDYLFLVGFFIMFTGIISTAAHISYVGYGICFMVPTLAAKKFHFNKFFNFNLWFFVIMWILSIAYYISGLGGVSNIFH